MPDENETALTLDYRDRGLVLGNKIAIAYMTTGEPYIDEPDTCPRCGGDGWYVGHDDECYDTGDCVCSSVAVRCECQEQS